MICSVRQVDVVSSVRLGLSLATLANRLGPGVEVDYRSDNRFSVRVGCPSVDIVVAVRVGENCRAASQMNGGPCLLDRVGCRWRESTSTAAGYRCDDQCR